MGVRVSKFFIIGKTRRAEKVGQIIFDVSRDILKPIHNQSIHHG